MAYTALEELKIILREKDIPFFDDEQLNYYLSVNGNNVKKTAYQTLIVKAENSTMNLPGLSLPDTSAYFRRMAVRYRQSNSGILGG